MTTNVCPFCNGVLPALSAPPSGDKLPCPRCGEMVPAARWRVDPSLPPPAVAEPLREPVPGKRKTAFVMLGIMLSMAALGLGYMLWTTQLRQSRHPKGTEKLEPIAFRRPAELAGLAYLPKGLHVIAGLHVAELLDDARVGKPLLAEPRPVLLDWVLKQIPRTTGMELKDIDHLIAATAFDGAFPQLTVVVTTRRPISLEKIAEARPAKSSLYQEQPLYEFSLKPAGEAVLWCVNDKTMIYTVRIDTPTTQHLSGLSKTPRPLDDVLPAPLREAMQERLPKHCFLWTTGRLDQLGKLKDLLPLVTQGKADLSAVKDVKTFALGIEPVEGLTMVGNFQLKDANAAKRLQGVLEGIKIERAKSQKVELPPADVPNPWVSWQVRGDVAMMREWLNQGKELKK